MCFLFFSNSSFQQQNNQMIAPLFLFFFFIQLGGGALPQHKAEVQVRSTFFFLYFFSVKEKERN
jgi:hypothetical protein